MSHNPNNLTPEQVGEGYRLLDRDEILDDGIHYWKPADGPVPPIVERWNEYTACWLMGYFGNDGRITYRTNLTRAELRQARGMPAEHNPDRVPADMLPDGYRFFDTPEFARLIGAGNRARSSLWDPSGNGWYSETRVGCLDGEYTYCTPLSRAEVAEILARPEVPQPEKPRHPELCQRYGTE